ncbi:MAG TPA: serine/threonine-protein kinase [Myxococcaceae bacterium]|nr:serine/threonine-protein kinase [Myxococcaceae bacterium]
MTPEKWQRVDALVKAALEQEPSQRAAFLSARCGPDEELRRQADALVSAAANMGSFLETPALPPSARRSPEELLGDPGETVAEGTRKARLSARAPLSRGAILGRYFVLDVIGEGGMGIVYAAYDPELNRKLAIKLLHPGSSFGSRGGDAKSRLLREAQAMARLSHPNVITVHDVGMFEGQVFVAMEYVEGCTLRQWLESRPREVRDVLRAFLQAGRGLCAAHAAGLVHRDFKPDNVLMGNDGRVCVLDFGLARSAVALEDNNESIRLSGQPEAHLSGSDLLASPVTRVGALIGTPHYMAPEQFMGLPADARADQFSFCAALYQALYGHLPFAGETLSERLAAIQRGEIRGPSGSTRVPGRFRQILARGLSANPDHRYPRLDDLLAELQQDPSRTRKRLIAVAGLVSLLGATAWAGYRVQYQRGQVCKGAERKLAGVWDDSQKQRVSSAFLATRKSYAAHAARGVGRILDDYAQRWVAMETEACEATRLRGEQSEELLDLRMSCLSHRRQELKAMTDIFAAADAKLVEKAVTAAQGLSDLEGCANAELLKAPVKPPADEATRSKVEEIRTKLATVRALNEAGRYAQALPLVKQAAEEADSLHYLPLQAEALFLLGHTQSLNADWKTSEQTLIQSALAAQSGRHDEFAARAWGRLTWVETSQAKHPEVEFYAKLAFATIDRMGGNDRLLANPLNALAVSYKDQGKYDEATNYLKQVLALGEKVGDELVVGRALNNLGAIQTRQGKYDYALAGLQRSLEIKQRSLGPSHPEVASTLVNIGTLLRRKGNNDAALANYERSLEIRQEALGPNHPLVAQSLHNVATILTIQTKYDAALRAFQRALAIDEKAQGPDHPDVSKHLLGIGDVYLKQGQAADAIPPLERALSILERRNIEVTYLGEAQFLLARALLESGGSPGRARALARKAREAYVAAGEAGVNEVSEIDRWLADHR